MDVVFLLVQQGDKLVSYDSVIGLDHPVARQNVKCIACESHGHVVLVVLNSEKSLELLESLFEVNVAALECLFVVVSSDCSVGFAHDRLGRRQFALRLVLQEEVLTCANE